MGEMAVYGDGREFELPSGWTRLDDGLRQQALTRAMEAFGGPSAVSNSQIPVAVSDRVAAFYDPDSNYSGALFEMVEPNETWSVEAADLWAVSTLSMKVPPLTGRRLLTPGPSRSNVARYLHLLPPTLPITELTPRVLETMWDLYDCFRSIMASAEQTSNWWVFAAKLSARKRPLLFPVRDSLVCGYLSQWRPLGGRSAQLGWMSQDMQVFAYLMTSPTLRQALTDLREELSRSRVAAHLDWSDLRLLDAVLWTAAKRERSQASDGDEYLSAAEDSGGLT